MLADLYPGVLWTAFERWQMERQPKLTIKELPQDRRVPRDNLLRGASAEEVVGGVRAWLANERPSHRGVTVTLAADEESIRRVEQRWRRLCRKNGYPEALAEVDRTNRAATFFGEIALFPDVIGELTAKDVHTRAIGARTLMHEWWHIARRDSTYIYPFEEGSAEVFADDMCERAFGFRPPKDWRHYNDLAEGIELIGATLDLNNWYLPSRGEIRIGQWLQKTFLEMGFHLGRWMMCYDLSAKTINGWCV
jgi:hypothetical protein